MAQIADMLEEILVTELQETPERARELIKKYPEIAMQAAMTGHFRAVAMALQMADSTKSSADGVRGDEINKI